MSDTPDVPYQTITASEASELIAQGTRIIDVRQPEEWQGGHIAEASLVPLNNSIFRFGMALRELNLPAEEPVIFVCHSGMRSATACEIARVAGLQTVYNLKGGMVSWSNGHLPIVL